jgi:hypothetical protein
VRTGRPGRNIDVINQRSSENSRVDLLNSRALDDDYDDDRDGDDDHHHHDDGKRKLGTLSHIDK